MALPLYRSQTTDLGPVVASTTSNALTQTIGAAASVVDANLTVADGSTIIASATVSISNYVQGRDVLALPAAMATATGITASFDVNSGS